MTTGRRVGTVAIAILAAGQLLLFPITSPIGPRAVRAAADIVRILIGPADSLDPARQGDIGSAAISAQLFETLTAIDGALQTRPALAASWEFRDSGRTVVFHLRPDQAFSDGSPLTAADVVERRTRGVEAVVLERQAVRSSELGAQRRVVGQPGRVEGRDIGDVDVAILERGNVAAAADVVDQLDRRDRRRTGPVVIVGCQRRLCRSVGAEDVAAAADEAMARLERARRPVDPRRNDRERRR